MKETYYYNIMKINIKAFFDVSFISRKRYLQLVQNESIVAI